MFSWQPAIKKSMLHAIIRYMQKKIEAPAPMLKPCKLYTNTLNLIYSCCVIKTPSNTHKLRGHTFMRRPPLKS